MPKKNNREFSAKVTEMRKILHELLLESDNLKMLATTEKEMKYAVNMYYAIENAVDISSNKY